MINGAFDLDYFVNRDSEIKFILEQCIESLKRNRPTNPQFIEFKGVWGIGKTTMLKRIQHHCEKENLPPIWIEVGNSSDQSFHRIAEQIRSRYEVSFASMGDSLDELLAAIRALLAKYGAAVIFIDSLDTVEEEHLKNIEEMLHRSTEINKLLFVMASKKIIEFKNTRPIGRKLKPFPLKSFSRDHCIFYIRKFAQELKEEEINQIFLLTGGYPMAVNVAVQTIKQEHLDPTAEPGWKRLVHILNERVIERGILAGIRQDSDQFLWYQTILSLFAVPRRFNLTIMQRMTERFAEQYKLGSSLLYMSMHQRINLSTGLLDWDGARTGYSMESPVRHLFLVKLKAENPDRHTQIHEFLMEENWRLAMEVSGTDRVHYIQEYLYHSAFCLDNSKIEDNIDKVMKQIPAEVDQLWLQFEEEYKKDDELQDALGLQKERVLSKIYQHFADRYWELIPLTQERHERISSLRFFLFYSLKDPTVADRLLLARQSWQRIKAQETVDVCCGLFEALSQDAEIKDLLGNDPQAWNLE